MDGLSKDGFWNGPYMAIIVWYRYALIVTLSISISMDVMQCGHNWQKFHRCGETLKLIGNLFMHYLSILQHFTPTFGENFFALHKWPNIE